MNTKTLNPNHNPNPGQAAPRVSKDPPNQSEFCDLAPLRKELAFGAPPGRTRRRRVAWSYAKYHFDNMRRVVDAAPNVAVVRTYNFRR